MSGTWIRRAALVVALGAWGCGSDEKPKDGDNAGGQCDGKGPCVDSVGLRMCPVSTGYDGDELAVCPPEDDEEGLLLHYGPSNYDDPDEVAKFVLEAGGETEDCVYVRTPNTKEMWLKAYHGRMRPLSHHLIVTVVPEDDGPKDVPLGVPMPCNQAEALSNRWLLGSQDPQIDIEIEGASPGTRPAEPGDPEFGAGQKVEPNTLLRINMHYVNTSDKDVLREAWVYLKSMPKEEVKQVVDMITFFQFNISVPPNSTGVETAIGRCQAPSDRYVNMVTGHFHEHGTRFTVWHEKADGETTKIYETFDWDVPGNAFYTDRLENPPMDGSGIWGATSGYVLVKKGEYINFQCEFDNPSNTTVTFGELGRDQMCNVFGVYYPSDGDVWNCVCYGTACL
jgi:hypothetical protein